MHNKPFIRSYYNYDKDSRSIATGIICPEDTLTQQHFRDEADINVLVKRFKITGELPQGVRMPTYEDFSEIYDFHTAANAVAEANEAFMEMPADVRTRFRNDPAQFVAFCSDERNRDEAQKMGLLPPKQSTPPADDAGGAPTTALPASVTTTGTSAANQTGKTGQ